MIVNGGIVLAKYTREGYSYDRYPTRNDSTMYQYGNTARELAPQYEEEVYYEERQKRPVRSPSKKHKKGKKRKQSARVHKKTTTRTQAKTQAKAKRRPIVITPSAIKSVLMIVMIFAGAIAFMSTKVQVDNISFEIRQANEELKSLQDMNAILSAELANEVDLDYIKEEAMTRLGMAEPQPYQIIHIDVPKTGYTVQYTDATD